jgi:hypothetical protein
MRDKGNSILFDKPQGGIDGECPALKENDFVLIIMND